jgi:hypothetical protein
LTPPDIPDADLSTEERHAEACKTLRNYAKSLRELSLHTKKPKNPHIDRLLAKIRREGNVFIGGFGLITEETQHNRLTMAGVLKTYGVTTKLLKPEAAGDFCYAIYDHEGVGHDKWEFLLTGGYPHSAQFLADKSAEKDAENHNVNHVIGIGGFDRLPAIKAALKGKLFNVLVTDRATGEALLADSSLKAKA